jgi:hypothetical protein
MCIIMLFILTSFFQLYDSLTIITILQIKKHMYLLIFNDILENEYYKIRLKLCFYYIIKNLFKKHMYFVVNVSIQYFVISFSYF